MLKNGVKKYVLDIIEYLFFICYLSVRNYWFYDYVYNMMFFGINMNIMLYFFEFIFYDVFDVYLLLIFIVIVLFLMMSVFNGWQGNIINYCYLNYQGSYY